MAFPCTSQPGYSAIKTWPPRETYTAVFQDDLIRSYRAFLDKRRATRPAEEYREPTEKNGASSSKHFQLRKVAMGDCGRPYGSSCQHEHAPLTELATSGIDPIGADGQ